MKARDLATVEGLAKHKLVLEHVGLALENREIGEQYSINEIASDVRLHHRTVRKSLEHIHFSQNFIPRIDLIEQHGRMYVSIEDLPTYLSECVPTGHSVLLKLFNRKTYFGKKTWHKSIRLNHSEAWAAVWNLKGLIDIDWKTEALGLTEEGATAAFKMMEDLTHVREITIKHLQEGLIELRKRKDELKKVLHEPSLLPSPQLVAHIETLNDILKDAEREKLHRAILAVEAKLKEAGKLLLQVQKEISTKPVYPDTTSVVTEALPFFDWRVVEQRR